MSDKQLSALGGKSFEVLKLINPHGAEYWSARDLQPMLGLQSMAALRAGRRTGHKFL